MTRFTVSPQTPQAPITIQDAENGLIVAQLPWYKNGERAEMQTRAETMAAALNAGETPDKRGTNELGAKFWKQAAPMYLACLLAKMRPAEPPLMAATDAAALHAYGRTYTKVRVAECNRELTARDRTRALNARKAARAVATVYGLDVDVSGDGLGLCLCGPVLAAATRSDASISLGD